MKTYLAEKNAGINLDNNLSFVVSHIKTGDISKYFNMSIPDFVKSNKIIQSVEELLGQTYPDLALIVAILVSTGWNRNDEIFTTDEVWKSRFTPLHKPMNDSHQGDKILGHIVKIRALDKSGNELDINNNEVPSEDFDLEVAGVLYKSFPELSEKIDDIITKAQNNEIFVSMEAWFTDFSYGLLDTNNNVTNIIERNEDTAFLTKHLKVYGGNGQYQGYKIGRVLKNIIFRAQGFVDIPANPDSIIKIATTSNFVNATLNDVMRGGVGDVDEDKLRELQIMVEDVQCELAEKDKKHEEIIKDHRGQIDILNQKIDELTMSLTKATEKVNSLESANSELNQQLDQMTKRAEKSEAELSDIKSIEAARNRLSQLSKVKSIDDEDAVLADLRKMSNETFELILKYAGEKNDSDDKNGQVLSTAKEEDTADFNTSNDVDTSESDKWILTAKALCRSGVEENQGGE